MGKPQAVGRCVRPPQKYDVWVYTLLVNQTVDILLHRTSTVRGEGQGVATHFLEDPHAEWIEELSLEENSSPQLNQGRREL
jgi:hypothetical protein